MGESVTRSPRPPAAGTTRDLKPAGVWRRLLALLLDYGVILAWMAFLGLLALLVYLILGSLPDTLGILGPVGSQVLYFFLLTFVVGVYLYRCESGPHHATWGKRRTGLAVVGVVGAAPSRRRVLVRTVVKLLPWELSHFFVWQMMWTFYQHGYDASPPLWVFLGLQASSAAAIVYIAMVIFTGRGPHDRAAGTVVVGRLETNWLQGLGLFDGHSRRKRQDFAETKLQWIPRRREMRFRQHIADSWFVGHAGPQEPSNRQHRAEREE